MIRTFCKCNYIRFLHDIAEPKVITQFVKFSDISHANSKLQIQNEPLAFPSETDISYDRQESVLEKCEEDISYIAPYLKPTFNFAAYINRSETLQNLLKLDVDLYKLEKMNDVPAFIIGLDFEKDMKEHILFLHDLNLETHDVGTFITRNPFIFKEKLEDLQTRINYLKYKKFDSAMVTRIMKCNPLWLRFSTQEIDTRLGFFQNHFSLTGNEVRALVMRKPKIVTFSQSHIKISDFVIKEEMGFTPEEAKSMLLQKPGIFMKRQDNILQTFEYLHRTMKIPTEDIAKWPEILTCRVYRLKERYLFLQKLNRVQFDPRKTNYISLIALVSGSDSHFSTEVAKSSIQAFNEFLKSL